jgi:hypothetical protein
MVDNSSVESLKVYDFDVQRVKKIHNLFALIDTSAILFLNENGDKVFNIGNKEFKNSETLDFKFTDVVAGSNNEIFIIGAEIMKDSTFQIYVFKVNENGQNIWTNPAKILITVDFDYELYEKDKTTKVYFFISENGYALGCFSNNKLYLVVNYQSASSFKWYYKLIALDEAGSVLKESLPIQESHPEIWNYMIEPLPNGNLITSLAVGSGAAIHQFDSNTLELKQTSIILASDIQARLPIFTNMLHLNSEEVIFTGHANKENNLIVGGNFDAFLIKYNTTKNIITDTLFSGANSSYELTFHSFIDENGTIRCIGTKRENLFISHGPNSSLYETNFNLNSNLNDSLFIIQNKGYEGLYFEPVGNSGLLRILGSKLDISGKQNKQAFFTILKP